MPLKCDERGPADFAEKMRHALRGRRDISLALLFGSRVRGQGRSDSDVDVAVLAPNADLLVLAADLSVAMGAEVHVVSLLDPGVPLLEELIREAIVVHEGFAGAAASWRSRALASLETDRPWYARMRESWLQRVAERGI